MTKTDRNWKKLFEKYNIPEKINKAGHYIITSAEINEFREARLMTKFDHRKNLPLLFQKYNLSILPITRGKSSPNLCVNSLSYWAEYLLI